MPRALIKTVLRSRSVLLIFALVNLLTAHAEKLIEPPVVASLNGLVDILIVWWKTSELDDAHDCGQSVQLALYVL